MGAEEPLPENLQRRHFAAGDYITRHPESSEYELEIDTPYEKPGWKPRITPKEFSSAVFPGTAIQFEQHLYEVVNVERRPPRFRYFLRAWDPRFPVRVQFHYTAEECAKLVTERKQQVQECRTTLLMHILSPLVGLLPAPDQKRIENQYGVSCARLTLISSFTILLPAAFATISLMVQSFGAPPMGPAIFHDFFWLGPYFFCESIARIINAGRLEEPIGSLPVYLIVETYRTIRRNLDPNFRQRRFEKMETGHKHLISAVDEVREVEGKEHDLEVISILPKPHWTPLAGIRYEGIWYGYLDSEKIGQAESVQYRFRLKRAPEGMVFRSFCEYIPEEVTEMYRQKRRRDTGTWIATFSPLWGLLDGRDQKQLEEMYGFEAMRFTRWTIVCLGLLGFFNFLASILNLAAHIGTAADVLWMVVSAYLLLETYLRWKKWKQGEPSGSILGIVLQPLAARLLRE